MPNYWQIIEITSIVSILIRVFTTQNERDSNPKPMSKWNKLFEFAGLVAQFKIH